MSIRLEIDHSRQESGKEKRQEQLDQWISSEINQCSADRSGRTSRLNFQTGAIFLSACQTSDYEEIERILELGDKKIINYANSDGLTALHQASIDGNIKMIKYLIEQGADINVTDNEGWNCLHASASCGYVEIAKFLIESGINITEVTSDGELASDVCSEDSPKMEKYLEEIYKDIDKEGEREKEAKEMYVDSIKYYHYFRQNGVKYKPEPVDDCGASPLHVAAAKGYTVVLRIFLEAGFNIDRKDEDGWTPLHAAAHWEQFECCKILAAYGANFSSKNNLSQKPFDVVSEELLRDFENLQKKRITKDALPALPDLPPPSPNSALMLPDQPQKTPSPSPPPEIYHPVSISTKKEDEQDSTSNKKSVTTKPILPPSEAVLADPMSIPKTKREEAAARRAANRAKYGIDDETLSLSEARAKFGDQTKSSQKPRAKRLPSSGPDTDDEKRKHMSQPVPNQLANVEQNKKAKNRRKSRQSTQGVTLDVVADAKKWLAKEKEKKSQEMLGKTVESKPAENENKEPEKRQLNAYIPKDERPAAGNPQMERLKAMSNLAMAISSPRKKSPNSSNDQSPLDEQGPQLMKPAQDHPKVIQEHTGHKNATEQSDKIRRESSSSDSKVHGSSRAQLNPQDGAGDTRHSTVTYPTHLSTINTDRRHKSPQPPTSPRQASARPRKDSESSRKVSSLETPQKCRKMATQLLERIRIDSSFALSINDSKDNEQEIDFKKLYREEKAASEAIKKQNQDYSRELIQLKKRIAELEIEVGSRTEMFEDNSKLKQENAALIRIISKLSKQ